MTRVVVDTNVPIVANGRPDPSNGGRAPSIGCRLAAIEFLEETLASRRVVLDIAGDIQAEYRRYLHAKGQPGVGDRFYQQLLMSAPARVERLDLPHEPTGEYVDFPKDIKLLTFDPSDRKFVAMARRANAPIANATDTDWLHHKDALNANGVTIQFICGCDNHDWFVFAD